MPRASRYPASGYHEAEAFSFDVAAVPRVGYNPRFCLGTITKLVEVDMPRMRIGIGHDTHRLEDHGPLRLGGIDHDADCHLVGVSDADVLLHALTDALLGAAGLGDIGDWFPDTDPKNRDRDSTEMLLLAYQACRQAGYEIANLDCIVFAERPKLGPRKRQIADRIASILQIDPKWVNVKAKTGEGLGSVGRGQAMMAECIVLLNESNESNHPKN